MIHTKHNIKTIENYTIQCIVDCKNTLGEGPYWSTKRQCLFWLDIKQKQLHQYHPETGFHQMFILPFHASGVAELGEDLILATDIGVVCYSLVTETHRVIAAPESHLPENRSNETKCDPQGRFWFSTMDNNLKEKNGSLYRLDPDMSCHKILDGLGIPNTLAWTADQKTLFFGDSMEKTIYAFDFDTDTGAVSNQRTFFHTQKENAVPDGSAIDRQNCLWNAQWDAWRVVRYDPQGNKNKIIDLPVQRPTSCMFGGANLNILFVTSARKDLTEQQLEQQPLAGGLFAIKSSTDDQSLIQGFPETTFSTVV